MKKNGEISLVFLLALILGIVVLVSLTFFIYQQRDSQIKFKNDVSCKLSVKASAETHNPELINCPRNYIKVRNSNDKNVESTKHTIAQSLATCRNKYSEGTEELFNHIDTSFCGICDVVEFQDDKMISNFDDYLIDNNVTLVGVPKTSYISYLV